jgi:uncharacterized protein YcbX
MSISGSEPGHGLAPSGLARVGTIVGLWRYPVKSMAGEPLRRNGVGSRGLWGDRRWAVRDTTTGEIYNAKRFPILMQCAASCRSEADGDTIPPVDVMLPDGEVVGCESPILSTRLSSLLGRPVALHAVEPASNRAFYRRRVPGAGLMGRMARFRAGRYLLTHVADRGLEGGVVREEFGRETGESIPDLSGMPPDVFEFYTPPGTFFDVYSIHLLTTSALAAMSRLNPASDWDVRRFRPNVLVETVLEPPRQPEADWAGQSIRIGHVVVRGEIPTARCAMPSHAQRGLAADKALLRTIVREADHCLGLYATVTQGGHVSVGDAVEVVYSSGSGAVASAPST